MQILSSFAIATISNVYFHACLVEYVSSRHPITHRVPSQYKIWQGEQNSLWGRAVLTHPVHLIVNSYKSLPLTRG